uniref:Uncharacterized protein n=1 Tax=Schlesneria paludicola TaxID=360056 RepID=A0A7C4LPH0_9PLAN
MGWWGSPFAGGLTLATALWGGEPATLPPAKVYQFGEQRVVVQPGPAAVPSAPGSAAGQVSAIRRVSFVQPADAFAAPLPTQPPPPEVHQLPAAPPPGDRVAPLPPLLDLDPVALAQRYRQIYAAIPFDRAEYEANPSYRHEATMELLFGQMRPMVVERRQIAVDVRTPPGMLPAPYSWYGFNSYFFPIFSPGYRVHRSF